jgi:ElaB/YqjD/DUF883 family membrane-anchored ribosome-binding protein
MKQEATMKIADNVSGLAHEAVDKMTNSTNHVADVLGERGEQLNHLAHDAVNKVAHSANHAADVLSDKAQQLKKGEENMVKDCQHYVRDNPVASLGIAVAAGFLLSRLLSGR